MFDRSLPIILLSAVLTAWAGAQTNGASDRRIVVSVEAGKTGTPFHPTCVPSSTSTSTTWVNRSVWAEIAGIINSDYVVNSETAAPGPVRGRQPNG
jgi:hypothetical protein